MTASLGAEVVDWSVVMHLSILKDGCRRFWIVLWWRLALAIIACVQDLGLQVFGSRRTKEAEERRRFICGLAAYALACAVKVAKPHNVIVKLVKRSKQRNVMNAQQLPTFNSWRQIVSEGKVWEKAW